MHSKFINDYNLAKVNRKLKSTRLPVIIQLVLIVIMKRRKKNEKLLSMQKVIYVSIYKLELM